MTQDHPMDAKKSLALQTASLASACKLEDDTFVSLMTSLLDRLDSNTGRLAQAKLETPNGWRAIVPPSSESDTVRLFIVEPVELLLTRIIEIVAWLVVEDLRTIVGMKTDQWLL